MSCQLGMYTKTLCSNICVWWNAKIVTIGKLKKNGINLFEKTPIRSWKHWWTLCKTSLANTSKYSFLSARSSKNFFHHVPLFPEILMRSMLCCKRRIKHHWRCFHCFILELWNLSNTKDRSLDLRIKTKVGIFKLIILLLLW